VALLSVNVNKIATLRNSRGGAVPSLTRAIDTIVDAGCRGITIHPRADQRHITAGDVLTVSQHLAGRSEGTELNIEGDPRPDLMKTVLDVRPSQCTLVPVRPGEVTSEAGWNPEQGESLRAIVPRLKRAGIRVSVFVEPDRAAIEWAAEVGADRIELYTEPYARAFEAGAGEASLSRYITAAARAQDLGLGLNAGHDLDLNNLALFRGLPGLDEVSIGHALMSEAVFSGLSQVVRAYLAVLAGKPNPLGNPSESQPAS
jgi:pyridoxine 5-phosphate synthase